MIVGRKMRMRSLLPAVLIALSVAGHPIQVAAQVSEDAAIEGFDWKKFADYSGCAVAIAFAAGTGGWLVAGLACYRAYMEHRTS